VCVEASWREASCLSTRRGVVRGVGKRVRRWVHTRARIYMRARETKRTRDDRRERERSFNVETPRARDPDAHGEMRFSRRVRSRPRGFGSARRERTCETRAPRLKAADLPALTATGAVSEAMADMVAETWTRARGVRSAHLVGRHVSCASELARVQVENGYYRKVILITPYKETKNIDQKDDAQSCSVARCRDGSLTTRVTFLTGSSRRRSFCAA
jgi:hypothetical protein